MDTNTGPATPTPRGGWASQTLAAFQVPGFTWLWAYNALGSLGMSMQMLAQGWLALLVTDSAFWVGAVFGMQGIGLVGFGAFGGVLADRVDRRKALIVVQVIRGVVALLIGLLVIADRLAVWHLMASGFLQGVTMAAFLPLNNALTYDLVGRRLLLNAMAVRNIAFNLARIIGSLAVGFLTESLGIGACYLFIAGAMFISPAGLLGLRSLPARSRVAESVWRNLADGLAYVTGSAPIRTLLVLSVLMELFGFSYFVMLPVIARDVLRVDATGFGYLSAANAIGSLVGTVILAGMGDLTSKARVLILTALGVGASLLVFALSPWFLLSLVVSAFVGASLMSFDATIGTILQLIVSDAMRGRVMGIYGLTFGFTPLGGFLAGTVATVLSAPAAVGVGAAAILVYVLAVVIPRRSALQSPPTPEAERSAEMPP